MALSRCAAPATAVAAVALLAVGVAGCRGQSAAGQPTPPSLSTPPTSGGTTTPMIVASPALPGVPAGTQIQLIGTLPTKGPARGGVRSLADGEAAPTAVRALADALGLSGQPRRANGGWQVTGPGVLRIVNHHGQWWTYVGGPVMPPCYGPIVRASGAGRGMGPLASGPILRGSACPMKPGQIEPFEPVPGSGPGSLPKSSPEPVAPPPTDATGRSSGPTGLSAGTGAATGAPASGPVASPPSGAAAEKLAKPVLHAGGAAGGSLRITTIGSYTFVSADPVVDGLATSGFSTTVGVGPGDRITEASGWLGRAVPGASYPLIGAPQAFIRLRASARPDQGARPPGAVCTPHPDQMCPCPDNDGCPPAVWPGGMAGPPRPPGIPGPLGAPALRMEVTGAVYGLALSYNRGEPLLVPSWLFSVAGGSLRIPEIAIDPRYLG